MHYVLVLIYFLSGGLTASKAVVAPDLATCEAVIPAITAGELGKRIKLDEETTVTVLDVQGKCVGPFSKQDHA